MCVTLALNICSMYHMLEYSELLLLAPERTISLQKSLAAQLHLLLALDQDALDERPRFFSALKSFSTTLSKPVVFSAATATELKASSSLFRAAMVCGGFGIGESEQARLGFWQMH